LGSGNSVAKKEISFLMSRFVAGQAVLGPLDPEAGSNKTLPYVGRSDVTLTTKPNTDTVLIQTTMEGTVRYAQKYYLLTPWSRVLLEKLTVCS
jgi:hypothetical protein